MEISQSVGTVPITQHIYSLRGFNEEFEVRSLENLS